MIRHYKRLQYGEHKKYNFYTPDTNRKHLKILILIYNTIKLWSSKGKNITKDVQNLYIEKS